ncbi:MAG TPA: hypothetical protein VF599_22990 [Pyrinomonadaceae bacterium]
MRSASRFYRARTTRFARASSICCAKTEWTIHWMPVGGIAPQEDISEPKANGISEVFPPGTSNEDIVKFLRENVKNKN